MPEYIRIAGERGEGRGERREGAEGKGRGRRKRERGGERVRKRGRLTHMLGMRLSQVLGRVLWYM